VFLKFVEAFVVELLFVPVVFDEERIEDMSAVGREELKGEF
jgi:hypothetical protein